MPQKKTPDHARHQPPALGRPDDWRTSRHEGPVQRLQIDLSIDNEKLGRVTELLADILTRIKRLEGQGSRLVAQGVRTMATHADVQAKLAQLQTDVESETDIVTNLETLMTFNAEQMTALRAQLAEAIASNDPAALQAVVDLLDRIQALNAANKERTVALVVAHTPAEIPVPPPVEPPVEPPVSPPADDGGAAVEGRRQGRR